MANERITDTALPNWEDLQIQRVKISYTHLNNMQKALKIAVNKNFEDIKKLYKDGVSSGTLGGLDGATLSRYADEILQDNDDKIPSSKQVYTAINNLYEDVLTDALELKISTEDAPAEVTIGEMFFKNVN